jgi:AcrR family transcriptional regulator
VENIFHSQAGKLYLKNIFHSLLMREKIIEVSLQEFLTHGIRTMTMQKLVLSLGISTKTMYKYFNNKEELLEECLKLHYKGLIAGIRSVQEDSPNVVVSLYNVYSKSMALDFGTDHLFYHDLNYYYPELQDKAIKLYSNGAGDALIGLISQGVSEGYFLDYLKAPLVLQTLTALYSSVTRSDVYKDFDSKRELIKHTVAIYLRGICTEKGLQIMNELKGL